MSAGCSSLFPIFIELSIFRLGRNFIKFHSFNSGLAVYNFSTKGKASNIPSALITKSLLPFLTELISKVRFEFILCNCSWILSKWLLDLTQNHISFVNFYKTNSKISLHLFSEMNTKTIPLSLLLIELIFFSYLISSAPQCGRPHNNWLYRRQLDRVSATNLCYVFFYSIQVQ